MVVSPQPPRPLLVTTAVFIGFCCLQVQHALANSTSLRELLVKSSSELDKAVEDVTTARQADLEVALRTYEEVPKANMELTKVENFRTAEKVLSELEAEFDAAKHNKREKMGKFPHSKEAETVLSKLEAQFEALDDWKKEKMEKFRQAKEALKVADPNDAEAEGELEKAARQLADLDGTYQAAVELLKNTNKETWEKKTLAEIRDAQYVAQKAALAAEIEHLEAKLVAERNPDGKSEASAKERAEKKLFVANQKLARVKLVRKAREFLDKSTQELKSLEEEMKVLDGQKPVPTKAKMSKAEIKQQELLKQQLSALKLSKLKAATSQQEKVDGAKSHLANEVRLLTQLISYYFWY